MKDKIKVWEKYNAKYRFQMENEHNAKVRRQEFTYNGCQRS